jgi:hypothetical protein
MQEGRIVSQYAIASSGALSFDAHEDMVRAMSGDLMIHHFPQK